jgi:tetratricopeptide (TPR) repeat protein
VRTCTKVRVGVCREGQVHELEATERPREELEDYQRLLVRDPDSLRFAEYADHLRQAGQLDEARTICEHGLARHPAYSTGHVVMGEILSDANRLTEAESAWREALRLDPGHPRAHFHLGELHLSRGEREHAIEELEAALLHSQDFPEARAKLAELKGSAEPAAPESRDPRDRGGRMPGKRPEWLTDDELPTLMARAAGCPSAATAALLGGSGALLRGELPRADTPTGGEAAVGFLEDARNLLSRLGAGRLRSALICGEELDLRCVPLGDLALVVRLCGESPIDAADEEIEEALLNPGRDGSDEGDAND